jgi:hypothetical protein
MWVITPCGLVGRNELDGAVLLEKEKIVSASQIPRLLWNLKVHYHGYKSLPLDPILCQMNLVHILNILFLKIHFIIIFSCMPRFSK